MKSVQDRSDRYERERREASERHRRKLEQMSRRRKPLRLEGQPHDRNVAKAETRHFLREGCVGLPRRRRDKSVPPVHILQLAVVVLLGAEPICVCRPDPPLEMLGHGQSILRSYNERRETGPCVARVDLVCHSVDSSQLIFSVA